MYVAAVRFFDVGFLKYFQRVLYPEGLFAKLNYCSAVKSLYVALQKNSSSTVLLNKEELRQWLKPQHLKFC